MYTYIVHTVYMCTFVFVIRGVPAIIDLPREGVCIVEVVVEGSAGCINHSHPGPEREGVRGYSLVLVGLVQQHLECLETWSHGNTGA